MADPDAWPELPLAAWRPTLDTLHLWLQIAGKLSLGLKPMRNHFWQSVFYVTSRGLTTAPIPYGTRIFEMVFDFIDHHLRIDVSDGGSRTIKLEPRSVADFYGETMDALRALSLDVEIWTTPVEFVPRVPFEEDRAHAAYDRQAAGRCWRILIQADRLFKMFNGRFLGKSSPSHLFWGAFDLAVTRFSGRAAALYSGGAPAVHPHVMHESYSHEVISHGFWFGDDRLAEPAFYGYAVPTPDGFGDAKVAPAGAYFNSDLGEFILPYELVRTSSDPDAMVLDFMQSTYEAGATLGGWDRTALEERPPCPCGPVPHKLKYVAG
ncbi:MAG TPA: DUF5996 family protein [Chloroflexota bacterium]|nr:DUF5996 family protein [Chloroflexota bacterium]